MGAPDRPFAELQAVKRLEQQGWTASWLNGAREFISAWEPRVETEPSRTVRELVSRMDSRAVGDASCWDVFAWKPKLRFINMMRAGSSEMLSPSKLLWLQAALAEGVPPSTFEIWRWFGGALDGRVLRHTDYNSDRLDGWVEWQGGRLTYSDGGRVMAWSSTIGIGVPKPRRTYFGSCSCATVMESPGVVLRKRIQHNEQRQSLAHLTDGNVRSGEPNGA